MERISAIRAWHPNVGDALRCTTTAEYGREYSAFSENYVNVYSSRTNILHNSNKLVSGSDMDECALLHTGVEQA